MVNSIPVNINPKILFHLLTCQLFYFINQKKYEISKKVDSYVSAGHCSEAVRH